MLKSLTIPLAGLIPLLAVSFSCDFPVGELTIKNGTEYTVEISVSAHIDQSAADRTVLKPGAEKRYEWDRQLTEVVVEAQAYSDYNAGTTIGRPSVRGVEIVRDDTRVLTIIWDNNAITWAFKSLGADVFE